MMFFCAIFQGIIIMRFSLPGILIVMLLTSACAGPGTQTTQKPGRPSWIDNSGTDVVGKCGTHIRGLIAQEQCAYKNGLTYIAMSKGVSVDVAGSMTMRQRASQSTGQSYGELESSVKIDEKNIRIEAEVIDKWHDRISDIMYVLIRQK